MSQSITDSSMGWSAGVLPKTVMRESNSVLVYVGTCANGCRSPWCSDIILAAAMRPCRPALSPVQVDVRAATDAGVDAQAKAAAHQVGRQTLLGFRRSRRDAAVLGVDLARLVAVNDAHVVHFGQLLDHLAAHVVQDLA